MSLCSFIGWDDYIDKHFCEEAAGEETFQFHYKIADRKPAL